MIRWKGNVMKKRGRLELGALPKLSNLDVSHVPNMRFRAENSVRTTDGKLPLIKRMTMKQWVPVKKYR